MAGRSDEDLLLAARGDAGAFEELYRRHVDKTVRFAARRSSVPEEVVDLVAAVWLEVIASLERYDPKRGQALPWILGIAAHLCAAERRRRERERYAALRFAGHRVLDEDDYARLEREIDAAAVAPALLRAVAELPPSERAAAELALLDGLRAREVAAALGISAASARVRLARARGKLRAVLAQLGAAPATAMIEEVSP